MGIDVLCLSETWLYALYTDVMLQLPGKKCFRWDRSNGFANDLVKLCGRGVACYVDNSLAPDYDILNTLCTTPQDIELLTLRVAKPQHKVQYILTVYRPPDGSVANCFHILENILLTPELTHCW